MLFGVPDEIPDVTRSSGMVRRYRIIYWKCYFGHRDKFRGHRYCTGTTGRVPGAHRVGPPAPGGTWAVGVCTLAYMGQGHQPQEDHAPKDKERKSPKGGRHLRGALGRRDSSLAAPFLGGRAKAVPPPSPLALYIVGGKGGQPNLSPGASLSLP